MSEVRRIEWIDICRGWGIFLVILGHSGIDKLSDIYSIIYSFHDVGVKSPIIVP